MPIEQLATVSVPEKYSNFNKQPVSAINERIFFKSSILVKLLLVNVQIFNK